MVLISTTVVYIATKLVDQFISQEAYGWIKKALFPKKNYVNRLSQLIEETTIEFEMIFPEENNKVPFYQSQPLFEILNEHILFKELPNKEELLKSLENTLTSHPQPKSNLKPFMECCCKKSIAAKR